MWEVRGPNGSIIIYATHQGAGRIDVTPQGWAELERADVVIAEADEVHTGSKLDDSSFYLPDNVELADLISQGDVAELARDLGGDYRSVDRLKPWVAFVLLGARAYQFFSPSINEVLLERARQRGISTVFLETWASQVAYLDAAITPAKLRHEIRDFGALGCSLQYRLAAFHAGDDTVFINEVTSEAEPVVARIERWAARLEEELVAGHHAFVAIGIGQIVGPYGVLARLSGRGYRVVRR